MTKRQEDINKMEKLVNIIRISKSKSKINLAFNELVFMLEKKLRNISNGFNIAGYASDDIYQESLFALRYKAIKDYDSSRGDGSGPFPFDHFAMLCIRRHLTTVLRRSTQNKKRILNTSISLDQDRCSGGDSGNVSNDLLSLIDILSDDYDSVLDNLEKKEYYKSLFKSLFDKLSLFEKEVFVLYVQKYSYDQIAEIINGRREKKDKDVIDVKAVDNALVRLKTKAYKVFEIFDKNS